MSILNMTLLASMLVAAQTWQHGSLDSGLHVGLGMLSMGPCRGLVARSDRSKDAIVGRSHE